MISTSTVETYRSNYLKHVLKHKNAQIRALRAQNKTLNAELIAVYAKNYIPGN